MKRQWRACRSDFDSRDVQIVPSIEVEDSEVAALGEHFGAALESLAKAGIFPIRIVHGAAEPGELDPVRVAEARAAGIAKGVRQTVERLKDLARLADAAGNHVSAYALLNAAVKIEKESQP